MPQGYWVTPHYTLAINSIWTTLSITVAAVPLSLSLFLKVRRGNKASVSAISPPLMHTPNQREKEGERERERREGKERR